jgi:hypothetical protein
MPRCARRTADGGCPHMSLPLDRNKETSLESILIR